MRRYRMTVGGRDFELDVQELSADRFDVSVGGECYAVTLAGDEDLPDALIEPGYASAGSRPAGGPVGGPVPLSPAAAQRAATPAAPAPRRRSAGGGAGLALNAPMPGVILELHVKVGDVVERGQQIAVLDAMKMHNFIGAPRAGTIAEVCVAAGQAVGHGEAIVRFAEA